ncbi:MAG: type IV pilin protein [Gammaproteobacteria bacterium]|jgi:type IV pilus assembly protein PilE|nr:type IV pilin protein [Gammaproteobacteria bacterium]
MQYKLSGFTLIELMITVALLAIITTISIASYQQYMLRANRTDASAFLLRIAAAQERWFLDNNEYSNDPSAELRVGTTSEHGYYEITITRNANPATGYRAVATPVAGNRQSTDPDCQELSIDATGLRESAPKDIDVCWR